MVLTLRTNTGNYSDITGASLLWVAIMGVIVIYIYALVAFAFFRPMFDPDDEKYCSTLAQCSVTLLRYGGTEQLPDVSTRGLCRQKRV